MKAVIKHDHSEIEKLMRLVEQEMLGFSNLTNEIKTQDILLMKNTKIDILNARGMMILAHIRDETEKKIEIFDKAAMNLPSKTLFPPEKIISILKDNSMNDKVHAPIFFTSEEIHELYLFESCITAYDPLKKEVQSVLDIPIADYSNSMKTIELPIFGKKDLNKINSLESISRLKIDRILCSRKSNSIRFLAFENLKKCQRHLQKNFYVCLDRQVQMKYEQKINCDKITNLPEVLVIEKSERSFLILNYNESLSIYCNGKIDKILSPDPGPVNLIIPNECSLRSNSLEIGTGIDHNDKNISFKENETKFHKIKMDSWSFFVDDNRKMKLIENKTEVIDEMDEYDEDIDDDLAAGNELINYFDDYSAIEVAAFAIAITVMVLGSFAFFYLYKRKVGNCDLDHSLSKINENIICKLQIEYDDLKEKKRINNEKTEKLLKEYESMADESEVAQAILRLLRTISLE